MLVGQGTLFFCNRTTLFNDIINDKKKDNIDFITGQLKYLSNKIVELHNKGIPLDAIINTLDTTLNVIKEEKNSTKILRKN